MSERRNRGHSEEAVWTADPASSRGDIGGSSGVPVTENSVCSHGLDLASRRGIDPIIQQPMW